ncbi:MAG: hypothetical protein FWF08_06725 [Oscillospiraceae bacterium]|nr:hypothetical protein [Oscillospiraceae bacterium]
MLSIIKDVSDFELKSELWSGALDTLDTITENEKIQDLMSLLEEMYPEPVNITTLNDLLWFDDDFIFEQINIKADEEDCICTNKL